MRFKTTCAISADHIHLSVSDYKRFFGDHPLMCMKQLHQNGQYACIQTIDVIGAKDSRSVRLLGPCRAYSQLEISKSTAMRLGLKDIPVRESGDIDNTPLVDIEFDGIENKVPAIIAKRHLHITPSDAKQYNLKQGQKVCALFVTNRRSALFDCIVRISSDAYTELHLDTDEANAVGATPDCEVIIDTRNRAC